MLCLHVGVLKPPNFKYFVLHFQAELIPMVVGSSVWNVAMKKNCCLDTTHIFPVFPDTAPCQGCVYVWRDAQETARTTLLKATCCHVLFNQRSPGILLTKAALGQDSVSTSDGATVPAVCQQWRGQNCCLQRPFDKVTKTLRLVMLCIQVPRGLEQFRSLPSVPNF